MLFEITLLGVRGSLPTPYHPQVLTERIVSLCKAYSESQLALSGNIDDFFKGIPKQLVGGFGGNTTCVQVKTDKVNLILDAGTGIRHVIPEYMNRENEAHHNKEIHLFFTHFHWDHILGLPFFAPIYVPGNTIHFYAVQDDLEKVVRTLFQKPFFPVPYEELKSKIVYHQLQPRLPYKIQDVSVTPYMLDHPDPCWGFKISYQGKTYSHCVDHEAHRVTTLQLGDDLPLYQDVDLMVFDAQYSIEEAKEKLNWGHSTAPKGLEIALREKIKKVIFVHHDPFASDEQILLTAREAVKFFESLQENEHSIKNNQHYVEWEIGYEGMMVKLI